MTSRGVLRITLAALVVGVLVDWSIGARTPYPGYGASIGLVGCVVIIVASKWLGKALLQRAEDYYPADTPADDQQDLRHG